ncbi:MAG: S-adenosylmethionine synthetase [Microcystaceae cyanobacterium]
MNNEPTLNKSLTDWTRLDAMDDEDIDLSDCPEITPEMLASAKVRHGMKSDPDNESITVKIDPDVAKLFPNSAAVNEGLRLLMRLINNTSSQPN